jgi:serine/threonine protein phosphatase PrpC
VTRPQGAVQRPAEAGKGAGTPPPTFDFEVAKLTDVGRARPHNEDYVDYYIPPDPRLRDQKGALYLVADGMGGHQAGEVASRGVVELTIAQYYSDTTHDIGTSLVRAFRLANQRIHEQAQSDPAKGGMGSTLVAAVVLGRKVYVANVGDSRAYLINAQGTTQISEDHSWVEEQVRAKLLTPEQARRHPQRNLVTRALGSKPDVQVDLFEGELNAGDILLLCTDGLTGRVEDPEIAEIVRQHPPQEAARQLVALANERGGNDNISLLIVKAQQEAVTVAAPVLIPVKKKPARKSSLVPVLIGVAAVLVLVLGGLLGTGIIPLFVHKATPSPTSVSSPVVTPATPRPPTLEVTLLPTATVVLSPQVTVTPTVTFSPTVALSPTVTLVPSETVPVMTATPTPTKTRRTPTATNTPKPTASQQPPTLVSPVEGVELQGPVSFQWDHPAGPLSSEYAYQVLIWREGEKEPHQGAAEFTSNLAQSINLDEVPRVKTGGPGRYFWSVVIVRKIGGKPASDPATPRLFLYLGPVAPPQAEKKPTGGSSTKPTPGKGATAGP